MERAISAVGLVTLLGLAFIFSKHRSSVQWRTVIWGVSLQLLLALTILSQGTPSFVGLFVLAALITVYIAYREKPEANPWIRGVAAVLGGAAVVGLSFLLAPFDVSLVVVALALLVLIVGNVLHTARLNRYAFAAALLFGVGLLWERGIDGREVFGFLSTQAGNFLGLSFKAAEFMFGNLAHGEFFSGTETWPGFGFQFAFTVLPTIIFFSAFMAVMYYLGIVQVVILAMARFMNWSLKTSGSETTSVSANVFVGQTEAPFLIKPFLDEMTPSELNAVMVGGFATIAGGVLAAYIGMGVDPGHLIAASVMSAPAALGLAKLLYPETEESATSGDIEELPEIETADNLVGAAANGTTDGLKLALNVAAMLIAFIALVEVVDWLLGAGDAMVDHRWLDRPFDEAKGEYLGYFPGSLATIFGTLLAPLAFLMGVPWADAAAVGNLFGLKMTVNEFLAYQRLGEHLAAQDLSPRAIIISTYALCGFANVSSIGIQIGGIGALAPERRQELASIGVRAMLGGAMASFMTATIAGILL